MGKLGKNLMKAKLKRQYRKLFLATDAWFNKTTDKHGDDGSLMAKYQIRMSNAIEKIKKMEKRK